MPACTKESVVAGLARCKQLRGEAWRANRGATCGFACCSCCLLLGVPIVLLFGLSLMMNLAGVYGYDLATDVQLAARVGASTGDWGEVTALFHRKFWLSQATLVAGGKSGEESWLVSTRGSQYDPNRKMRVFSASKWVAATVIYCVVEDDRADLTNTSVPADFIPWWRCDSADDVRCASSLTVEKLLAFRHGLPSPGCENGAPAIGEYCESDDSNCFADGVDPRKAWDECAKRLFAMPFDGEDSNEFDTFKYSSIGLFLAGLMALHAWREAPGRSGDRWSDMLFECVTEPSGIVDATDWSTYGFKDGEFGYSYTGSPRGSERGAVSWRDFPGLSGSLACSPLQYAQFLRSFLSGELVSERSAREITRDHGATADGDVSGGLSGAFSNYAQGNWYVSDRGGSLFRAPQHVGSGDGSDSFSHSMGAAGFFPWMDRTSADPREHYWGLLAIDMAEVWYRYRMIYLSCMVPLMVVSLGVSAWVLRRGIMPIGSVDDTGDGSAAHGQQDEGTTAELGAESHVNPVEPATVRLAL
eukprot:TRINITY_DN56044_c0_g1_i1.p1 TRINITY_DN56044_c0_g1~~TRINITY_DN56044_c0_g1_i1.p1  ORF type:complete len:529 (-),score=34.18 TRINITY_DN56044_c0_g1_i1:80-1666(-)